ncbi:MAG: HIT family protein [archaeon]
MEDCIFCKIIDGQIPCSKVYEDSNVLCFLDNGPVNKGHLLVVPKQHAESILDESDENLAHCMVAIKKVAGALMKAMKAEGFNVINNAKPAAGQVIFHTHFHIIPRFANDGHRHWPQSKYSSAEEMDDIKLRIIKSIG